MELYYPPPYISSASTTTQAGFTAGKKLQFETSRTHFHTRIKLGYLGTLKAEGLVPNCHVMMVRLTEEIPSVLVQETPLGDSNVSGSALDLLNSQMGLATDTDVDSLAFELQECSHAMDLAAGEQVHAHIISCGHDSDRYLGNLLILMYGNCGSVEAAETTFLKIPIPNVYSSNILINAYAKNGDLNKAKLAFDHMPQRNVASWNAMISALAQNGNGEDALQYYHDMLAQGFNPDLITFVSAIDACADVGALAEGVKIHSSTVDCGYSSNVVVGTALINMYGKCGSLYTARSVFQHLPQHDVLSWSAMMAACVNNGCNKEALSKFHSMQLTGLKPSRATFLATIEAYGKLTALSKGHEMHACMVSDGIESDIIVENALINMYGKCRSLPDAVIVFCKMMQRNVITWSTMIAAHAGNDQDKEALQLFYQMQTECINPNNFTFSIVLDVCASMKALAEGLLTHNHSICSGVETDFIVAIALINMYGECGMLDDARAVFGSLVEPEVVTWNAMISACVLNGQNEQALKLVKEMQSKDVKPNMSTFKIIDGLTPAALTSRQEI